jgi:hypothetical protein
MLIEEIWCKFVRWVMFPVYCQGLFIAEPVAQCQDLTKFHRTHRDTALLSFKRVLQISRRLGLDRSEHSGRNCQTRCQWSSFPSAFGSKKSIGYQVWGTAGVCRFEISTGYLTGSSGSTLGSSSSWRNSSDTTATFFQTSR